MLYLVIPFISDEQSPHRDGNLYRLLASLNGCDVEFEVVILYWGSVFFDEKNVDHYNYKVHIVDLRYDFPFSMLDRYKHIPSFIGPNDIIHTLDCDMYVRNEYLSIIPNVIDRRDAFFPVCFSLYEGKHPVLDEDNGWWRESGWGMRVLRRKNWDRIDFSNYTTETGRGEDMLFLERAKEAGLSLLRFNCKGLFHMWHPTGVEYQNRLFNKVVL